MNRKDSGNGYFTSSVTDEIYCQSLNLNNIYVIVIRTVSLPQVIHYG